MNFLIKKIIPYILVLVIFITSICTCYYSVQASSAGVLWLPAALVKIRSMYENSEMYQSWYQSNNFWTDTRDAITTSLEKLGLPNNFARSINPMGDPWQEALIEYKKLCAKVKGKNASEVTDDEAREYVNNAFINCHFGDNNIEFSNDMNILLKNYAQDYIEASGIYPCYSYNLVDFLDKFSDGYFYNSLRRFILNHQDQYYVGFVGYRKQVVLFEKNNNYKMVGSAQNVDRADVSFYDYESWNNVSRSTLTYSYDSTDHEFKPMTDYSIWFRYVANKQNCINPNPFGHSNCQWFTVARYDTSLRYTSLDLMKRESQGYSPYYITNTWNNFVNNQGDTYTIDNSNVNNVTYGDVNNYITNNYPDNPPDYDTIVKWIENQPNPSPTPTPTPGPDNPNPTPTPTPGPDNPSPTPTPTPGPNDYNPWGTTVSGNGTGGDTDGWSFWDFLKNIFNALKNIGTAISNLLLGILDWFTIDTEAITTELASAKFDIGEEFIPVEDFHAKLNEIGELTFYYPKLEINTPTIIKQYYEEDTIVLLDFKDWDWVFSKVRLILKFTLWFAYLYSVIRNFSPRLTLS